jgi:hypothetical protein
MSDALHDHGLVRTLQEEIRSLLQEDEAFFAPPRVLVIAENIGDLESQITQAIGPLNTGGGVVIVGCPEPGQQNAKIPFLFPVSITIQCLELAIVNRSMTGNKVHAERLAENVHILLRNYEPTSNGWTALSLKEWRTGPSTQFNGYVADILTFTTETVFSIEEVV